METKDAVLFLYLCLWVLLVSSNLYLVEALPPPVADLA
jgi:hypothetical protein